MKIKSRLIGKNEPSFIVAEVSCNHKQQYSLAAKTIIAAKDAGADAVKFQAYTPDTITIDSNARPFMVKHAKCGGQTLYELYKKAYTPWSWFRRLKKLADGLGLVFFATAFDRTSVDFLEDLGVDMHKISSFELVDLPLIEYAASKKKPLLLSTGMARLAEIKDAIQTAKRSGAEEVALLKCVSSYPAKAEEMNLNTIPDMARRFHCPIGLSDHTLGISAAVSAVSLGARIVEKHIILSRKLKTPDSFFSTEPREFKEMVSNIRVAEAALGRPVYGPSLSEKSSRIYRRSLFVVKDVRAGEKFSNENIKSIRPGNGLKPVYMKSVIGRRARTDIEVGTPLSWRDIR